MMNRTSVFQKVELIRWNTELNNLSIVKHISVINENITTMLQTELLSIEQGLDDLEQDRVVAHVQVKKRYEKWL